MRRVLICRVTSKRLHMLCSSTFALLCNMILYSVALRYGLDIAFRTKGQQYDCRTAASTPSRQIRGGLRASLRRSWAKSAGSDDAHNCVNDRHHTGKTFCGDAAEPGFVSIKGRQDPWTLARSPETTRILQGVALSPSRSRVRCSSASMRSSTSSTKSATPARAVWARRRASTPAW